MIILNKSISWNLYDVILNLTDENKAVRNRLNVTVFAMACTVQANDHVVNFKNCFMVFLSTDFFFLEICFVSLNNLYVNQQCNLFNILYYCILNYWGPSVTFSSSISQFFSTSLLNLVFRM